VDLGDHDALSALGAERAERRRDRRLADAALAGDEEQPVVEEGDVSAPLDARVRERHASPSQ
jgi:hypothetical protein